MTRNIKPILLVVLILIIAVPFYSAGANAQTPQETLNQYISDLQKNPNDNALREKIIRHVQTMKPAPAVPKEAERFMTRGAVAVKSAKDANDFKDAVAEFEKATLSAPWLANAYYNLGIAQEKAGLYDAAIKNLKLYLLAAPNAPDADKVEKLVYEIEYRQEKAAKEVQQREAPKILLSRLKSQYDGATFSIMYCSHLSMQGCGQKVGYFPCGCNESERNGTYWYTNNDHFIRIVFPSDNTIFFIMETGYYSLKGTPKGPRIEDIVWEYNSAGAGPPDWKPGWVQLSSGLDQIMFSGASYGTIRPFDGGLFNPYERYNYMLFKKR